MERKVGIEEENQDVLQSGFTEKSDIVISNKFATFAFTCPGRGYRDYQVLKVLHLLVKRLYSHFGLECDTNLCNNYE